MPSVERFAPSPTGRLHLGHAYSAMLAHDGARAAGGKLLLRIEDLDAGRAREAFVEAIFEDLAWLGLNWETPVLRQSSRGEAYAAALARLGAVGLLYPCVCTRAEIAAAAPQEGAAEPVYSGACRNRDVSGVARTPAWRLDVGKAIAALGGDRAVARLGFEEIGAGPEGQGGLVACDPDALRTRLGDVALGRKDGSAAYHLAVVVDDGFQRVTHVTRGCDLFASTPLHRLLQALLDLPTPVYRHHRLIRDEAGRRLAKRDDARALATLRAEGATPRDVRRLVGLD
jgi:glutamyl-Q tRNA(Asp) synthetase